MKKHLVMLLSFLLSLMSSVMAFSGENPIKKTFQYSVVEVMIDRTKDENAELNKPIPWQKIPFKQRTDKYLSIGTAWFINEKELFSASHVFSDSMAQFTQNFYVRNIFGEVFAVDAVTLYSNRYDVVSFTLKSYPKKIVPISIAKAFGIGDDVCVPGNALGQGISLRCGGQISSLAPEPRNGEWREVYFSTPVSPGNSGGPLIDGRGRAIGIVIRKIPGEDLNIATPFSELRKSGAKLEFVEKDLGFQNGTVVPLFAKNDLLISSSQAMPMMDWMKLLMAGANDHLLKMAKVYESSWLKNGVLTSKQAKPYLRNPKKGNYFTLVKFINPDLSIVDGDEGELERPRAIRRNVTIQRFNDKLMFFVEKNRNEKFDHFIKNPKEIMDALLATGKVLHRRVADEDLVYNTLGEPTSRSLVTDLLGRNWSFFSWKLNEIQGTVGLFCTTRPSDVACLYNLLDPLLTQTTVAAMFRVDISELMLGYYGSSVEWADYLAPSNRLRPTFMSGLTITKADGKATVQAQDLSIVSQIVPGANDSIAMTYSADVDNPLKQVAFSISYFPNVLDKIVATSMKVYRGLLTAPDSGDWVGMIARRKPFDGTVYRTKRGKFMASKLVEQKNENTVVMGYMYGDEEKKLSRFWKGTAFGLNASFAPAE